MFGILVIGILDIVWLLVLGIWLLSHYEMRLQQIVYKGFQPTYERKPPFSLL